MVGFLYAEKLTNHGTFKAYFLEYMEIKRGKDFIKCWIFKRKKNILYKSNIFPNNPQNI